MNFSTRTFFLVMVFYSVLIAITFSFQSLFGFTLMTFLALIVFPPFVQVGVFTTSGFRRAFFIGLAIGGIPHFAFSLNYGIIYLDDALSQFANNNGSAEAYYPID